MCAYIYIYIYIYIHTYIYIYIHIIKASMAPTPWWSVKSRNRTATPGSD